MDAYRIAIMGLGLSCVAPVRSSAARAARIASCARSYVCFGPVTPVPGARDRLFRTTRYRAMRQSVRVHIPQE